MNSPSASTTAGKRPPVSASSFQGLRIRFLQVILWLASLIGTIVLVNFLIRAITTQIVVVVIIYVVLLVATIAPLPYHIKAGTLLGIAFLLGLGSLLQTGIYGLAPLYFLGFCLLAAFLFDWRFYLGALALSLAAIALLGFLLISGRILLTSNELISVGSSNAWIMITAVMVGISAAFEEGWRSIRNELVVSQETLKTAMDTLAVERASVEDRINARTRDLVVNTELANTRAASLRAVGRILSDVSSIQDLDELMQTICRLIVENFNLYHTAIYLSDERNLVATLQASAGKDENSAVPSVNKVKVGQGIIGVVVASSEPHISERTREDLSFEPDPSLPDTRSLIALPMIVNKQVIGVLELRSDVEQGLGEKELEVLALLANQVSVAISNTRLSSETRLALTEARVVYGQYMRQAWEQYSVEKQKVGYRFDTAKTRPIEKPLDLPEIQAAVNTGEILVSTEGNPTITIPLKLRDQVIGVLDVRSGNTARKWNENERALVQAIADRVALALENARLFEETTRRADREKAVSEITTRIRSTNDPQVMLQTALDELKRALGAREIHVRPYIPSAPGQNG